MDIDVALVRSLIAAQFPQWAHLPVRPVERSGWDNRTFRLGDELSVRLPSAEGYVPAVEKEQRWLPYLGPRLPLPIPVPVGHGGPGAGYPYPWSVYRWIEGTPVNAGPSADPVRFATDLAAFLVALRAADPADAPGAGPHSFWRGGPLEVYDPETRHAITLLAAGAGGPDAAGPAERALRDGPWPVGAAARATAIWEESLAATWTGRPVWFHGDVAEGNLLVRDGRLAAVLDFGTCGVGDPAGDLRIAWTLFDGRSRAAFRKAVDQDEATWARARGWTLPGVPYGQGHLGVGPGQDPRSRPRSPRTPRSRSPAARPGRPRRSPPPPSSALRMLCSSCRPDRNCLRLRSAT